MYLSTFLSDPLIGLLAYFIVLESKICGVLSYLHSDVCFLRSAILFTPEQQHLWFYYIIEKKFF
jgi:hypothetical protein